MEILSNIWMALNTENELLMKIQSIPFIIIEAYLSLLLFTTIMNITYSKNQKYAYIIGVGIIGIITMHILPIPAILCSILNYAFLFVIIKYTFKISYIKTILAMIIPMCIYAIIGSLILNPIIKLFHIDSYLSDTVPIHRATYVISLYVLTTIIVVLLKIKKTKFDLLDNLSTHNKHIIYINLVLGSITLFIQMIITMYYLQLLPIYITFLSTISLIFYFIISFYSLNHILKLQKTTMDLENAENYNKTLSFLYDNVKGFKHDFDDIVNMIGGYVKTNDIDGLKKYYIELEKDYKKVKNIATLNPNLINNPGIYNLLVSKYKKASDLGVKIHLEYFFDFERINMPIYQFSRMFGILLDNAIEAATNSNEKQVNISFRDSSSNKTQIIIVENSYSNKEIDTSKIFEKGVSEKKDHMGMGLWEVNQIIMQNNNIHLVTTKDDTYFKQQLEIYY